MTITLEAVTNIEQQAEAACVRREVFGTEWASDFCPISPNDFSRANQVIARVLPQGKVVATLTVLDTTGNQSLHEKYKLSFRPLDRVARYTHLAVLESHRGLNLPHYMVLEARQLYVVPGGFAYTWLLFQAERAMESTFCKRLGFSVSAGVVEAEQGPSRVLIRDEKSRESDVADIQTRLFLDSREPKTVQVVPGREAAAAAASMFTFSSTVR